MLLVKESDIAPRCPELLAGRLGGAHWTMAVITSGKPAKPARRARFRAI
jgi:hypothetical protein